MAVKSFRGALNGGGNRREAGKTGSSKLHKVFTPFGILWNYDQRKIWTKPAALNTWLGMVFGTSDLPRPLGPTQPNWVLGPTEKRTSLFHNDRSKTTSIYCGICTCRLDNKAGSCGCFVLNSSASLLKVQTIWDLCPKLFFSVADLRNDAFWLELSKLQIHAWD